MGSGTRDGSQPAGFIEAIDPATGAVHEVGVDPTTKALLVKDASGATAVGTVVTALQDTLAQYKLADYEVTATYIYVGKLDKAGNWYLMRITLATGNTLYSKGASGYTWANRASPTPAYASFDSTF